MVSSPYAQMPMRHQRVSRPAAVRAWISISIQLPAGVSAVHDGISCEKGKRGVCHDDVQLPVVPPLRTMPSAGGLAGAPFVEAAGAHARGASPVGAGTREPT